MNELREFVASAVDEKQAFITRWRRASAHGRSIQVPLHGCYCYRWERGDGTEVKCGMAHVQRGELLELPVDDDGDYVLKAGPIGIERLWYDGCRYQENKGTPAALRLVEQWGSVVWKSMSGAFAGCRNVDISPGAGRPDLSLVRSLERTFINCVKLNSSIGDWDVSRVENMGQTFRGCRGFNQPLLGWNVSRVESMAGMFQDCSSFNQPLEGWDVSHVQCMQGMFCGCWEFNQPLGGWNVSQVVNTVRMFSGCRVFNQPLGSWNLLSVGDMREMFYGCRAFNQSFPDWIDAQNLKNLKDLLRGCHSFTQSFLQWATSIQKISILSDTYFEELGIESSKEHYFSMLFDWSEKLKCLPEEIFLYASGLFRTAFGKRVSRVQDESAGSGEVGDRKAGGEQVVEELVLSPVSSQGLSLFHCVVQSLDEESEEGLGGEPVLDEGHAFITRWRQDSGGEALVQVPLFGNYAYRWELADGTEVQSGVASVGAGDLLELPMDSDVEYILKVGPGGVDRIAFSDRGYKSFWGTPSYLRVVEQWGSVAWSSMDSAFYGCKNMEVSPAAGRPDLSCLESMSSMFSGCTKFNTPICDWDVSSVVDMSRAFEACSAFNQPLEVWDVSQVKNMSFMFNGCQVFNQPLSSWDVSQVRDMSFMFNGCQVFNQPLSSWDVSQVRDMSFMFSGCQVFNQPLSSWNVSQVEDMGHMFAHCSVFNQPLGDWNVSNLRNTSEMFQGCKAFNRRLDDRNGSDLSSGCNEFFSSVLKRMRRERKGETTLDEFSFALAEWIMKQG